MDSHKMREKSWAINLLPLLVLAVTVSIGLTPCIEATPTTQLLIQKPHHKRSPDETITGEAEKQQSWTDWILGQSAPADLLKEVDLVSSTLDEDIGEELITESSLATTTSGMLENLANKIGISLSADRRKRSPEQALVVDETAVSTTQSVTSESSWWQKVRNWMRGTTLTSEDTQLADLVSSQLNAEIKGELQSADYYSSFISPEWYTNLIQMGMKAYTGTSTTAAVTENAASSPTAITPYTFIRYFVPETAYEKTLMDVYELYNNPENASYLKTIVLLARVAAFLTPGLGIVEQVNICIALAKITWKVANMYNSGYAMSDIAVEVVPELAYTLYMYRRDESNSSAKYILKPGQIVDVSSMDAEKFIHYTETAVFPPLSDSQEEEIRSSIDKAVDEYLPNINETEKKFALDSLTNIVKFLALLSPQGELKTSADDISNKLYVKLFMDIKAAEEEGKL